MPDDIRTQAATYIDGEHRRVHDDLIHEHRRQEQRMLSWEKSRLDSHARNREVSELRYAQRLGVTTRFVENRTLSRLAAFHSPLFALAHGIRRRIYRDSPLKILFQKRCQTASVVGLPVSVRF